MEMQIGSLKVTVTFYTARSVVGCVVQLEGDGITMERFDWAKCNPLDEFSESVGRAKALGRALAKTGLHRATRKKIAAAVLGYETVGGKG